jgi:hypothetical protein
MVLVRIEHNDIETIKLTVKYREAKNRREREKKFLIKSFLRKSSN